MLPDDLRPDRIVVPAGVPHSPRRGVDIGTCVWWWGEAAGGDRTPLPLVLEMSNEGRHQLGAITIIIRTFHSVVFFLTISSISNMTASRGTVAVEEAGVIIRAVEALTSRHGIVLLRP